jgi:hypothetical protein
MASNLESSLLLFIPEAGIYPYLRGHAVLGDAFQKQGGTVFITKCTGQMVRCPMMAMHQIPANEVNQAKKKLCKLCSKNMDVVVQKYGFKVIVLEKYLNDSVIKDMNDVVNVSDNELINVAYKGLAVGRVAECDFLLDVKSEFYQNLSVPHKLLLIDYVKTTVLSVAIAEQICRAFKPSVLLAFNPYAQCQGACHGAMLTDTNWKIFTNPVHFNVDASRFVIYKSVSSHVVVDHLQNWKNGKNIPVSSRHVFECWEDTVHRMYKPGSHIFSLPKGSLQENIYQKLKLDPGKKTIVAYTSSCDEMIGTENMMRIWNEDVHMSHVFTTQAEWLKMLRSYAAEHEAIQIVVRIHPREGGRQFGFASKHLRELLSIFTEETPCFKIVWPDDPVSSYDLMDIADLCLVPWTTIGQEAARLGIPVLSYTRNMYYPNDDFLQVATTLDEYREKLDAMLGMEITWQHLVKAIRFYNWRTFVPSLDLGETVPTKFDNESIWPNPPESKNRIIYEVLNGEKVLIEENVKELRKNLTQDMALSEKKAMQAGLRMFFEKSFNPPISRKPRLMVRIINKISKKVEFLLKITARKDRRTFIDYELCVSKDTSHIERFVQETEKNKNSKFIIRNGTDVIFIEMGKKKIKNSKMLSKLVALYEYSINL